jgi:hypothetical protein
LLLLCGSLGSMLLVGEAALRWHGGYRLVAARLTPRVAVAGDDPARVLGMAPDVVEPFVAHWRAARPDLDVAWLRTSPPPLAPPPPLGQALRPQHDWLLHYYVLNAALLRATWVKGQGLPMFPGLTLPDPFTVFEPPEGKPVPRYRYPALRTLPTGLRTNRYGFRGRDLPPQKAPGTVRIAFVGASTTVEAHAVPHSAPELIEHWLGLWAEQKRRSGPFALRFEVLNGAREAIQSHDIRAIVTDELLPLDLDYLVYYEGANQFQPATLAKHVQVDGPFRLGEPPPGVVGAYDDTTTADTGWLDGLAEHTALVRYLRTALRRGAAHGEPAKPEQRLTLAPELRQGPLPLDQAAGLLELAAIGGDLAAIRAAVEARGARLCVSTFWWLAHDGLQLDPVWGHNVLVHLNRAYWPFRYATVRTLADLQNRFFAAWAAANGVDLLDLDAELPHDPALAIDAIHHTDLGVRLKAWVWFAQLVTCLERDFAAGRLPAVPRPGPVPDLGASHPLHHHELDGR